ncbi:MAG: AMP-binding protein [Desulfovibrio sp.]|nr:AMP-binding protein [Desulfovibrio sp.]
MCMSDAPLASVPTLDTNDFLLLLQSFLHHRQGKHCLPHPVWLPEKEFACCTWQRYGGSPSNNDDAYKAFCAMFDVTLPLPRPHTPLEDIAASAYECWKNQQRTVTFCTSGSTGKPKPCTHTEDLLRQEVAGVLPLLGSLPLRRSALVTVPLHHLYGFTFGLLLPKALGVPLRIEAPLPTAVAQQMLNSDLVIGIPMLWTHFSALRHLPQTEALLLSATAPLPDTTLEALCDKNFFCLEIFGSTETGALGYRLHGHSPFTLFSHFTRVTEDKTHVIHRTLPDGSTCILPLQDTHLWLDERRFVPQGRRDHAVQVGGVNVFPERVARVLASHPDVYECAVRLMRPEEGQRLKAFVVPTAQATHHLLQELRTLARKRLCVEERPSIYTLGKELPRNAMGKLTDWNVMQKCQE